ncbi:hypothetical protein [Wenjunlia tyrosinilytica]|uniref:Secreted protein n=1 Tax=Wenjunlia tyrosinilytica TaxID=1544741 RepID=A0A917ZUC4_9ACTN|nr:hypothetical protein [Wenjunlia tyrosinilytica]GGO92576.1 hypothetical protein GCM10012280_43090 [Wenjunlia tyrosinilytica]
MNRATKALVIVLLAAVPTSYLVIAAAQSSGGSSNKKRSAEATEPLSGRPDRATRDIYDLPVPGNAKGARFFETNSWKTSSLYARFTAKRPKDVDWFLKRLGTKRSALVEGYNPITPEQEHTFGWNFHGQWAAKQAFAGVRLPPREKGRPTYNLLVNLKDKAHPTVYVVSTITF